MTFNEALELSKLSKKEFLKVVNENPVSIKKFGGHTLVSKDEIVMILKAVKNSN